MERKLPDDVIYILKTLYNSGFEAYLAGGAVRDMLRNAEPHDYDIATSARPEDVKLLFSHTIDTGIKHGTVTVVINKTGYEVTTFRHDGTYKDGRHPEKVEFVNSVYVDCSRRDFTINSMMYGFDGEIIDFFGGREDIKNKIIRCVGNPEQRFKEDALRMLRAVYFCASLSFHIAPDVEKAIKKCSMLIKRVSSERIFEILNKILLSPNPDYIRELHNLGLLKYIIPQLDDCFGEKQRNKYHIYDVGEHIMVTVKNTPCDLILRWAALLHDIGKPCCSSVDSAGIIHFYGHHRESCRIAVDILYRLHMDHDSIRKISVLIENHDVRIEPSLPAVKRMMARTGEKLFEQLMLLQKADNLAKNPIHFEEKYKRICAALDIYRRILAEGQPYLISHLVVNGRDLQKIGYRPGRQIGDTLKTLIDEVIIDPNLNNREYLLKRAQELKKSSSSSHSIQIKKYTSGKNR